MKKILFILPALFLAACSGFLRESTGDQLTEDQSFADADGIWQNAVAVLYTYIGGNSDSQGLQGTYRGVYDFNTFTTDEAMIPTRGADWLDGYFWQRLYLHSWQAGEGPLLATWEYLYKVIVLCNRSLATLQASSAVIGTENLAAWSAEIRALRAMYYWYLMDLYGSVPVVLTADTALSGVSQSPRNEVFGFIYSELTACLPLLSAERSNRPGDGYGRMTRGPVLFLLAKLALNAEVYTDDDCSDGLRHDGRDILLDVGGESLNAWEACIRYCDLLAGEGYVLEDDYAANFAVRNETSSENIFTIPMDKNFYQAQYQYLFRTRHYDHGAAFGCAAENGACAVPDAIDVFFRDGVEDPRFALNYYSGQVFGPDGGVVYQGDGTPLVYYPYEAYLVLSGSRYEKTAGARMRKYEVDLNAASDGKLQANDIVLFRYADVLLMKAEALLRSGRDGSEPFDAVRARAGAPGRECTLENILDERLMELCWEGWRRNDLVRFGLFGRTWFDRPSLPGENLSGGGYTDVFPLPANVLLYNPGIRQNPGY